MKNKNQSLYNILKEMGRFMVLCCSYNILKNEKTYGVSLFI
jgi:hypothetical protein